MNDNLIHSCADCELRNVCSKAFQQESTDCNMLLQEKCERAFMAVELVRQKLTSDTAKVHSETIQSSFQNQNQNDLWAHIRIFPANIAPEPNKRLLLLSRKSDGKTHAQFGSYVPSWGFILTENPALTDDIYYISAYPEYWAYMD